MPLVSTKRVLPAPVPEREKPCIRPGSSAEEHFLGKEAVRGSIPLLGSTRVSQRW